MGKLINLYHKNACFTLYFCLLQIEKQYFHNCLNKLLSMTKLSVNINKIATLRNSRGGMFRIYSRWLKMFRNLEQKE